MDLRLSSGIIACARRVRERACAVDRQSKNWFLDRRSAVSIPEQVVFMSLFVRRIPVSTVVDNTQIRLDSSGCTRYALSPNFLRMRIPERCERADSIWNSRDKKPYGSWRGESVKRKISLEPLFWYFAFLPISSTPAPWTFRLGWTVKKRCACRKRC